MPQLITIIAFAGLLTGCCTTDGEFIKKNLPNTCGTTGWTLTAIYYGDSRIAVIPVSEVVKDAEFRFILTPDGKNANNRAYSDMTVKVRGKPPHDGWFEEQEGKANEGDGTIRVCIDGPAAQLAAGSEIYYIVEVEEVGILDPRAKVIVRPE